jgi:hypothetical protein
MRTASRLALALVVVTGLWPGLAAVAAAQAPACLSSSPADWPSPSRPYFLVIADTTASMATSVGSQSSCGLGTSRIAHLRCALKEVFLTHAGRASFGLATFAASPRSCDPACLACGTAFVPGESTTRGTSIGCGPRPGGLAADAAGALIRVPIQQDAYWQTPPTSPNLPALLGWVDGSCTGNTELVASATQSGTPINGALRDAKRYLATGWSDPLSWVSFTTPLSGGERPCRSVNVVLVVDGDESCDLQADAVAAATDLYTNGMTVGGTWFRARVHVVNVAGGATVAQADAIAQAGGTAAARIAGNEAELVATLGAIVSGELHPETCNNRDDDCNGCVDEGFPHHADALNAPGCCSWKTLAQRTACGPGACGCCSWAPDAANGDPERAGCLAGYQASISAAQPQGDRTLLPCTTQAQAQAPSTWLCVDPGEVCDGIDNNGDGRVDEGFAKCGSPPHCPTAEVCNGLDDDCNGLVDDGNVCAGACAVAPSSEACDGCDDDCDGVADDGLALALPCGFSGPGYPAYCAGTRTCKPPVPVPPGTCSASGGFTACSYPAPGPQPEVCDGLDNDCNGLVDDGVPSGDCVPPGAPAGLAYRGPAAPTSACVMGKTRCTDGVTSCVGWAGPSAEVCDGLDNDCDGVVDGGVPGLGQACGRSVGVCRPGATACVNGAIVCQGGVPPQPEICDGLDNDCNGLVDDGPLADAPAAGAEGCWSAPGSCCVHVGATSTLGWCPPLGAGCGGPGVLSGSCSAGRLVCAGGGWGCSGDRAPVPEACNGEDDDCNGAVDDAVAGVGSACRVAEGECTAGVTVCVDGALRCGGAGPSAERCDGRDNDCNGAIDDGIDCGPGDACSRVTCPAGARCVPRGGGAACVGTETSRSGGCGTAGGPGAGAAVPALLLAALLGLRRRRPAPWRAPGALGVLLLAALAGAGCGARESSREVEVSPRAAAGCTPTNGGVEICNGLDDDCNGLVDDVTPASDPSLGTTCAGGALGACADPVHAGTLACRGGRPICVGPAVLHPYQLPETCNGADDDCNGLVDDDPAGVGTACGTSDVAPCRKGRTACQGGTIVCAGAVEPAVETCNGIDDDCDGVVDAPLSASEVGGACDVPVAPPAGATSPCRAGTWACLAGRLACVGAVGPTAVTDACGVDSTCDGALKDQPDLATDVHHCGACGNDCLAGAVHAAWACLAGQCTFQGCEPGYHDNGGPGDAVAGDRRCGYRCDFASAQEACNGRDDDCDGRIDEPEGLLPPSPVEACGVSPAATAPECTGYHATYNPGGVAVACVAGAWQCTFHTARVCSPTCAGAAEVCDAVDNDCNGLLNENVPDYGLPCASDDGVPAPGHGACRATGTRVCAGERGTACSAAKDLSKAGPEVCNGIDDDCDGLVDETYAAPGANPRFVRPAVTRIGASLWIYSYEASRPTATGSSPGAGNGYRASAPAGVTLDRTVACSQAGRVPWFDVTPAEVEQTCAAMGGRVCSTAEWQAACQATQACTFAYAPRGVACAVAGAKVCNLGPTYDFAPGTAGDQDGLLPAGSVNLTGCWADWSGLQGNLPGSDAIYDLTGNLREITKSGPGAYPLVGGSFLTQSELGATCTLATDQVDQAFAGRDAGFRCCFDVNPSP